jgi:organic hydroperoxide reductase OsmC/OhrA
VAGGVELIRMGELKREQPRNASDGVRNGTHANVDPEEAFVASLSSCHMLTFLAIACKQKFVLDSYEDEAIGYMEKNTEGRIAITRVELHPKLTWSGDRIPTAEELDKMHHAAHENCFIANSVKTNVTVVKAQ